VIYAHRMLRRAACGALGVAVALLGGAPAHAFVSPGVSAHCPPGMAFTPGGSFALFSNKVPVTVEPHCMDVLEVTNDAYAACARDEHCPDKDLSCTARATYGKPGKGRLPVTCVEWLEAKAFCAWRGMRLPTEGEWEWAARGGNRGSKYPWGDEPPNDQLCWSGVLARNEPCEVGTTKGDVNPWGIRDLAGNAWEWTGSDFEPSGTQKVGRGGYFENDDVELVSANNRAQVYVRRRFDGLGFRCVRP
jgi:sulfatase modifying factor 1